MNRIGNNIKPRTLLAVSLLAVFVAGCGGGGGGAATGAGAGASAAVSAGAPGNVCSGGAACVSLGAAGNLGAAAGYWILAKTNVGTTAPSVVTGNIGLSPAAKVFLTGWTQTDDVTNTFTTSP